MGYFFLLALILSGCCQDLLSVRREGITARSFASYYIQSDDSESCPELKTRGERLHLLWALPRAYNMKAPHELILTLHFWNHVEKVVSYPVTTPHGFRTFSLINEEFEASQGIQSFKVELISNGAPIATYKDLFWVPWIKLSAE
jgi:hypothetical protein